MHARAHAHLPCTHAYARRVSGQNSKTVFIPHSPGNLQDVQSQIAQGVMQGSQARLACIGVADGAFMQGSQGTTEHVRPSRGGMSSGA